MTPGAGVEAPGSILCGIMRLSAGCCTGFPSSLGERPFFSVLSSAGLSFLPAGPFLRAWACPLRPSGTWLPEEASAGTLPFRMSTPPETHGRSFCRAVPRPDYSPSPRCRSRRRPKMIARGRAPEAIWTASWPTPAHCRLMVRPTCRETARRDCPFTLRAICISASRPASRLVSPPSRVSASSLVVSAVCQTGARPAPRCRQSSGHGAPARGDGPRHSDWVPGAGSVLAGARGAGGRAVPHGQVPEHAR